VVTGAKPPPANIGDYSCGSAGSPTSRSATVEGLKNGQKYVLGVAAYDVVGNVGPMSIPQCEDPTPVHDFFNDYINSGGGAGGGFCSVQKKDEPASLSAFGLVGFATIVSIWRRRRKNKKSSSSGKRGS
ncbi:MAG: PEP-CTERM sorting domain-containing protein, partial [Polyangiaceae bacterium]